MVEMVKVSKLFDGVMEMFEVFYFEVKMGIIINGFIEL